MSDASERSFWLCHSCGAQMRPIRVDGTPQCASCNSEFIEILDSSVNPDPWHELPPSPPVRPMGSPPVPGNRPASTYHTGWPGYNAGDRSGSDYGGDQPGVGSGAGLPGILGGLFGSILGGGGGGGGSGEIGSDVHVHGHANQRDTNATGPGSPGFGSSTRPAADTGGGRTYQFNFGGGSGSVTFGTFGGGGGGGGGDQRSGMGMGPFGPFGGVPGQTPGGDQGGGLDAFFPGFPPPQRGPGGDGQGGPGGPGGHPGQNVPGNANDIIRAMMNLLADEGMMQGPQGRMDIGDYVASQHGFDNVLETLMQAAGPQGPLPATDAVIEGLPRFKMNEEKIEKSTFKDCPVCKDDFVPDDEVMRVPCEHLFHVDCLQPWLKTNGSCPVCRFSLVPDDANRGARPAQSGSTTTPGPSPDTSGGNGNTASPFANILNRLWGQSGATPVPASDPNRNPDPASSSSNPVTGNSQSDPASSTSARAQRMNRPYSPPPGSLATLLGEGPGASPQRVYSPPPGPPPGRSAHPSNTTRSSGRVDENETETFPNSIPEDYIARHRQREREQRSRDREQDSERNRDRNPDPPNPYVDDLD